MIWHHCAIHRVDPAAHRSRSAPKKTESEKKASSREDDSRSKKAKIVASAEKPPPKVDDDEPIRNKRATMRKAGKGKERVHTLKLARGLQGMYPPKEGLLQRLRTRIQRKTEESRPDANQDQGGSEDVEKQQARRRKLEELSIETGMTGKRRRIAKEHVSHLS